MIVFKTDFFFYTRVLTAPPTFTFFADKKVQFIHRKIQYLRTSYVYVNDATQQLFSFIHGDITDKKKPNMKEPDQAKKLFSLNS